VDLDPFNVRRGVAVLTNARRTLLPLPIVDRPEPVPEGVLPPRARRVEHPGRVSVVAAERGGDAVALVGMARVFEEARIVPETISVRSAAVLWGAMWAAGMSSDEMLDYSLSWRPEPELGVRWTGLPRFGISAVRGFGGLARGEAVEQLFPRHVWRMSAGHTDIPIRTVAYDLDRGRHEVLGSAETPDLTLGELARVAVAPPRQGEAVRIEGRFYGSAREPAFYDLFLDRRDWPERIRSGYDLTRRRLSGSPS
jgi:NTE family protein